MRLSEIRLLPLPQLTRVADILFNSGNLSADLVVAPLDGSDTIALLCVKSALLFDRSFSGALISQRRLHRHLTLAHRTVVNFKAPIEVPQPQGEQLCRQPALLVLEGLIAARRRGL